MSELAVKERTDSRRMFSNNAAEYMHSIYDVELDKAKRLMAEYIDEIDVNDPTTQHLGPDYFALQILMAENIIPYRPL